MIRINLQAIKQSINLQQIFNNFDVNGDLCAGCRDLRFIADPYATGDSPDDWTCDGTKFTCQRAEAEFNAQVEDIIQEVKYWMDDEENQAKLQFLEWTE